VKNLKEDNASYVLVRTHSEEDRWITLSYSLSWMGSRERFKVVYADDNYTIARFQQAEG
jgi:hypothetical protein